MDKTATTVRGGSSGSAPVRPVSVRRLGANIFGILAAKNSGPEPLFGWSPTRRGLNSALLVGGTAVATGAAASLFSACKSEAPEPETSPSPKRIPQKITKSQKSTEQLFGELHARIIGGNAAISYWEARLIEGALTHKSETVREQAGEAFALTHYLSEEDLDTLFGGRTVFSGGDEALARGGMKGLARKLERDPFDARFVIGAMERRGHGLDEYVIDALIKATYTLACEPHYGAECMCLLEGDCSPVRALYIIASSGRHDMSKAVPALFNAVENVSCSQSWAFKAIERIARGPGDDPLAAAAPDCSHLVVAPLARLVDNMHGDGRLAQEAAKILEMMARQEKDIKEAVPVLEFLLYHKSKRVDVGYHAGGALACYYRYHLGRSKFRKLEKLLDCARYSSTLRAFSRLSVEEIKSGRFTMILERLWRKIGGEKPYSAFVAHDMEPSLYRMLAQHYAIRGEWRKIKRLYLSLPDTPYAGTGNSFYDSLRDGVIKGLSALSEKGWDLSPLSAEKWYQKISVKGP